MSADDHRQGDMAQDAARAIAYAHERSGDGYRWNVIEEAAGVISCYAFGHPRQPRWWLARFKERPWRCARCGTWWVTKHDVHDVVGPEGEWRWHRVSEIES